MICYYHPDRPAVGICKYCQRGLCADDAALVPSTTLTVRAASGGTPAVSPRRAPGPNGVRDGRPGDDCLACKGRHEEQVRGLNLMEARGLLQARRMGAGYVRNAVFYSLVGILFAGFGYLQLRFLGLQAVFFMLIGLFLLYAAVANFVESRKYK